MVAVLQAFLQYTIGIRMKNQMISINAAEGIFYPAFDKNLCDDTQVSSLGGTMERLWDTLEFAGGREFTIRWEGEVDLHGYDQVICFITVPVKAVIRGEAVLDGEKVDLFSPACGAAAPLELKSNILKNPDSHKKLTGITLYITSEMKKNMVLLSWIGGVNSEKEPEIELPYQVKVDPKWPGMMQGEKAGDMSGSMIFTREEARELKKMIAENPKLKSILIKNAECAMQIKPESLIREFAPVKEHMYRFVRVRDRGRACMENHILNLAVAGYILEEEKYSSLSARMILSLAQMKWFEGPVCCMEGSQFHHVCFTEDHTSSEISMALEFLGGLFTDQAMELIAKRLEEAYELIREKCCEPGYRNYMNQGIVGNRGAMLNACQLQQYQGGYEGEIEACYQRHSRIIHQYLSEDGHCAEGIGYYEYSFQTSILLWHVYAKQTGRTFQEVLPKRFIRSGKYIEAIMSSISPAGDKIPLNCTGVGDGGSTIVSSMLLICMRMAGGIWGGDEYLKERLKNTENLTSMQNFDLLFYLYYRKCAVTGDPIAKRRREILFHQEGLASFQFPGGKLLVLAERNPYTAHFHEDRGTVILEADGKVLLPDLGTTNYANPVCLLMEKKEYHNLAYPLDLSMHVASRRGISAAREAAYPIREELKTEDMQTPEARIVYARETETGYVFKAETGMLYGNGITGTRTGVLNPEQKSLAVTDCWEFEDEHCVVVSYLSYSPWSIDGNTAVCRDMTIEFQAEKPLAMEVETGMEDWRGTPVYVLRGVTQRQKVHSIKSIINWGNPINLIPEAKEKGGQNSSTK